MRAAFFTSLLSTLIVGLTAVLSYSGEIAVTLQIGYVPVEDKIQLKWKSPDESEIGEYVIERSIDNIQFTPISTVTPRGDNYEYTFIDGNIFKMAARTFYYRLRINKKDGTFVYSKVVYLSPRISSAKQTWGSIKAIFH